MILKRKPELETFIQTCTPLAIIPALEDEMQGRVEDIANALLGFEQTAKHQQFIGHMENILNSYERISD